MHLIVSFYDDYVRIRSYIILFWHIHLQITEHFYTILCSVTVSVCTIKGTDCRLLELSKVSLLTGGQVKAIKQLTFNTIMRVIAVKIVGE